MSDIVIRQRCTGAGRSPAGYSGKGFHLMSASLSGPVVLPKIYNGRNRTFFLIGWQRHHENGGENNDRNVPSPAMLAGDFSFGGIGDPIYDPATLTQLPNGTYTRTPFAAIVIPPKSL